MKDYIVSVIKIAKEEKYLDDFISGSLYMNNLNFFISSEVEEVGDSSEATAIHKKIPNPYLLGRESSFNIRDSSDIYTPVFCLYAIKMSDLEKNNGKIILDEKIVSFGEYAVIITDFSEFNNCIDKSDIIIERSLIHYNDFNKITNHVFFNPITHKKREYSHQKEFRLYCPSIFCIEDEKKFQEREQVGFDVIKDNHIRVKIGELSKITQKVMTKELIEGVSFELNDNQNLVSVDNYDLFTNMGWKRNNRLFK